MVLSHMEEVALVWLAQEWQRTFYEQVWWNYREYVCLHQIFYKKSIKMNFCDIVSMEANSILLGSLLQLIGKYYMIA